MVYKKDLISLSKGGPVYKFGTKDGRDRQLPSRTGLNSLRGEPGLGNYSKATPGLDSMTPDILAMAKAFNERDST